MQGKIEVQGSPADLSKSGVDFAKLIGIVENSEGNKSENIDQQMCRQLSIRSSNTSITSHRSSNDGSIDECEKNNEGVQMEDSSRGKVKGSISINYFTAGANWCVFFLLISGFVVAQLVASGADFWVSIW